MRLNVYLQKAGAGSRREAERLVADGRVTVNGVKATPTTPVEEGDTVLIDNRPVAPDTKPLPRLFLLHKPVDVLVTHRDHKGRKTIFDLPALNPPQWTNRHPRVMNVGRLDVNSEGLLVLSSDGPLAQAMMSPDNALARLYRVRVRGQLTRDNIDAIAAGITIDDVEYRGAEFVEEYGQEGRANRWYRCVLTEGKNREIRKLFDHFGCVVNRLVRLQYGPFTLGDMEPGDIREVPPAQVKALIDELARKGAKL
ncbi:rRNA pseudouridine synthase [Aestuariivirga litoralis]|uniref:Pseudouridine synthase n=1 Tax=Aestuariivirga litoralis TaxID=2650924 RepID=A0A2W2BY91_9HYPH|nr:pseudouridine synthase [Aestuariivirga litoralis]PZF78426.1 rRNA pseudouridine synthase [Aestuariivirga litoralis]